MSRHAYTAGRIVLGIIFVVMGTDYFISFLPDAPASPRGTAFLEALLATGYLFPLIKTIEIACGLILLSGRAVLPALLLIAPVSVNIALYHTFLDRNGAWVGFLAFGLSALLLLPYRSVLADLFSREPDLGAADSFRRSAPVLLAHSRRPS
jgi:putative oxidoreductase